MTFKDPRTISIFGETTQNTVTFLPTVTHRQAVIFSSTNQNIFIPIYVTGIYNDIFRTHLRAQNPGTYFNGIQI